MAAAAVRVRRARMTREANCAGVKSRKRVTSSDLDPVAVKGESFIVLWVKSRKMKGPLAKSRREGEERA